MQGYTDYSCEKHVQEKNKLLFNKLSVKMSEQYPLPDAEEILERYLEVNQIDDEDVEKIESDSPYFAMLGTADAVPGYFFVSNKHMHMTEDGLQYVKTATPNGTSEKVDVLGEKLEEFIPSESRADIAGVEVDDFSIPIVGRQTEVDQIYAFAFDNAPEAKRIMEELSGEEIAEEHGEDALGVGVAALGDYGWLRIDHTTPSYRSNKDLLEADMVYMHRTIG